MEYIKLLVRGIRQQASLTQEQMSEVTDVPLRTLQRIEKEGTARPDSLRAIANAFRFDPAILLDPISDKVVEEARKKAERMVRVDLHPAGAASELERIIRGSQAVLFADRGAGEEHARLCADLHQALLDLGDVGDSIGPLGLHEACEDILDPQLREFASAGLEVRAGAASAPHLGIRLRMAFVVVGPTGEIPSIGLFDLD